MLESNKRVARVCISVYIILWAIIGASLVFYGEIEDLTEFTNRKGFSAENPWYLTMEVSFFVLFVEWMCSSFNLKDLLMLVIHGIILYGVNYFVIYQENFVLILLEVAGAIIIEDTIIVISHIREKKAVNATEREKLADVCSIYKCRGLGIDKVWHYGELRSLSTHEGISIFVFKDIKYYFVEKKTIGLCSGKRDKKGVEIYQGDIIENKQGTRFEVRYGIFVMYCPVDDCMMENIGFYAVAEGYYEDMPLGPTEEYATIIGNIYENPELEVDKKYRCFGY